MYGAKIDHEQVCRFQPVPPGEVLPEESIDNHFVVA